MKISEMNNDQATEALIRLAKPLSNICDDEEAVEIINQAGSMDEVPVIQAIGKVLPKLVTYALVKHRSDLYEVAGALAMKPTAEVGKMNFVETLGIFRNSWDDVLSGFFTQSKPVTKGKGKE